MLSKQNDSFSESRDNTQESNTSSGVNLVEPTQVRRRGGPRKKSHVLQSLSASHSERDDSFQENDESPYKKYGRHDSTMTSLRPNIAVGNLDSYVKNKTIRGVVYFMPTLKDSGEPGGDEVEHNGCITQEKPSSTKKTDFKHKFDKLDSKMMNKLKYEHFLDRVE